MTCVLSSQHFDAHVQVCSLSLVDAAMPQSMMKVTGSIDAVDSVLNVQESRATEHMLGCSLLGLHQHTD